MLVVIVRLPESVVAPVKVRFCDPPTVRFEFNVTALLTESGVVAWIVPAPSTRKVPVPSAAAFPNEIVPLNNSTPPVN